MNLDRRAFGKLLAAAAASGLPGCGDDGRYTEEDAERLEAQKRAERDRSGKGPYGPQRFRGYRGLADLPWFDLDDRGHLRCTVEDLPPIVDVHAHLGMSALFAPRVDLQARTPRVRHYLDCDGEEPGCVLDLDVYINANFTPPGLRALRRAVAAQMTWGSDVAATHTIPNLLAEMDDTRVQRALVLPIAFGLPFGDDLSERWIEEIAASGVEERLIPGASVHPEDPNRIEKLRRLVRLGARAVKLHPAAQRFFPDAPEAMTLYEECARLGLPVVFHGGRAGIEPSYAHRFTLMRYYEPAFARFPEVDFVIGHAGARDVADAIPLAQRHPNVWLDIHGQGVTVLHALIEELGGERLLFGSDWPFYHLGASLAKVLLVTEGRPELRHAILRGNAERLIG
jgi:predicted TIM-barrel fold metal-dependent hydrolase